MTAQREVVTAQREVADDILRNVRVMLRWAMLDDVEVVTRFGSNPRILQVRKGGEVIFTATVRGREAALPRPRQVPLPGTEDVVARPRFTPEESVAAPSASDTTAPTIASLGLFEAQVVGSLDDARRTFPDAQWRRLGGERCGALVNRETAAVLREAGATVKPFDPSLDPPVVVEVWDLRDEAKELASQLATELGGTVSAPRSQHSGTHVESWVELPATGDAHKLAWALSYLVENKVRFWVKPATGRAARNAKGGTR